jgi:hypothetical protein
MLEYKSPTFLDMPPVTTYLIEEEEEAGPFGAKEVGQGPLLPVPPALCNAIFDAVGVRIDQVPVHPQLVKKALDEKAAGRAPRVGPKGFPAVDFGEPLLVPTPEEGGDGTAVNQERKFGVERGKGTMADRESPPKDPAAEEPSPKGPPR